MRKYARSSISPRWVENVNEQEMVCALSIAISHAHEVGTRSNAKHNRAQRVGVFATSLRSNLHNKDAASALGDVRHWYDIGVLENNAQIPHVSYEVVSGWVRQAMNTALDLQTQTTILNSELMSLHNELQGIKSHIRRAEDINRDAEKLIGDLCDIFEPDPAKEEISERVRSTADFF